MLAAEYVLGALSPQEHGRWRGGSPTEPAFARLVDRGRRACTRSARNSPKRRRRRGLAALERRLLGTETPASARPACCRVWSCGASGGARRWPRPSSLGGNVLRPGPLHQPRANWSRRSTRKGSGRELSRLLHPANSELVRLATGRRRRRPASDYELWLIQGKKAPASMGVMPGRGRMRMQAATTARADIEAGTVFAISLEPQGGSPTGEPTGPVVAQGALRSI